MSGQRISLEVWSTELKPCQKPEKSQVQDFAKRVLAERLDGKVWQAQPVVAGQPTHHRRVGGRLQWRPDPEAGIASVICNNP